MKTLNRVLVVGASRGIGRALAEQLASQDGAQVTATVRQLPLQGAQALQAGIDHVILDLNDPDAGLDLLQNLKPGDFDAIFVNAGVQGPAHQDAAQARRDEIAELFWVNALAPVRLARRLLPLVRRGGVCAFMSSRMGSIACNDDGALELYRASKTALNGLARSFAVKDALHKGIGVLLLHPGWVQTDMGGADAPVTIDESVRGLRAVLAAALDDPRHAFLDYQGQPIDW